MTFFIILLVLCLVAYMISFNNRDKSQDYKIDPKIGYLKLVNEDKLRLDLTVGLEGLIKKSFGEVFSGSFITLAIGSCYKSCNEKSLSISQYYKLPLNTVNIIIKECTNNMFSKYLDNAKDYFV